MDNTKLVEMARGLLLPQHQNAVSVLQEIVELLDGRTRIRLRDYLRTKTMASLRQQEAVVKEAMKRYGTD